MDKNSLSVNTFNKLAEKYQDKYMSLDLYNDTFDVFCKYLLSDRATIIELGCGPGNITQYLLKRIPTLRILGTDLAPKMVELASVNNPNASFEVMDCRYINKLRNKYDGIICGFCLPYLSQQEVALLITNAIKILNQNGVIYLSTMEGEYDNSALQTSSSGDQVYIYYHKGEDLIELLKKNGFKVLHIQRKEFINNDNTTTTDLFITAQLK